MPPIFSKMCQNVKMSNFLLSRETQKSRRHLVHAKLKPSRSQGCKPPGTVKCGGRRCQVCEHLTIGDSFESTKTKTNCNSSNVVYLLCCKVCGIWVIFVLPQREVRGTSRVFQNWFKKRSQYPFYIVFGLLVLAFALSFCLVEAK